MTTIRRARDRTPRTATRYAIEVAGHLDADRLDDLGCIALRHRASGITVLEADVSDQAALHGILARLRDLGIPLLALTRLAPTTAPTTDGVPR